MPILFGKNNATKTYLKHSDLNQVMKLNLHYCVLNSVNNFSYLWFKFEWNYFTYSSSFVLFLFVFVFVFFFCLFVLCLFWEGPETMPFF